ncbi:MAG: hypothetical protein QM788_13860 [Roseateles sp.]|uniref:hypothetical protein n=1 Tax=Roseateles sp. TaxID=1971397 RepID=UPI0039EABB64
MKTSDIPGLAFAAMAIAGTAVAGDLRPAFNLPSQREAPQSLGRPAPQPAVPDAYYQQFEKQAQKLSPQDASRLRARFVQSAKAAELRGALAEKQHYDRLLRVLSANANPQ